MSCLHPSQVARIKAQIKIKEEQLEKANALYSKLLENPNSSYRFESGEGAQQAASRKLEDVQKTIDSLESQLTRLYNQLSGRGLTRTTLRRY